MKLFEDKLRDNYNIAKTGENVYNFYDTNEQFHIVKVRELLNKWFENYPENDKKNLKDSFKNQFYDSFYELFIHELFFNQGFVLIPHPILEGTTRKPDFLAVKGDEKVYIEATTVSYVSDVEQKKENFRDKFIEELDTIDSPIFWLGLLDLKFKKNNFPKVAKIRRAFEQKLLEINPFEIEKIQSSTLRKNILAYDDDNLYIEVSLLPKSQDAKLAKNVRTIGLRTYPVTIQNADVDSNKIYRSFKDKATRYGILEIPYITCLNLDFRFNLKHDVDWAFYDSSTFNSLTPKFTRVSAILVTDLSVGNIFSFPKHRLIVNKYATNPITIENYQLSYEKSINSVTIKKDIDTIMNLNGSTFQANIQI